MSRLTPARIQQGPSIFTVLQQTLGLRLLSIRGLVDAYVVHHIEPLTQN